MKCIVFLSLSPPVKMLRSGSCYVWSIIFIIRLSCQSLKKKSFKREEHFTFLTSSPEILLENSCLSYFSIFSKTLFCNWEKSSVLFSLKFWVFNPAFLYKIRFLCLWSQQLCQIEFLPLKVRHPDQFHNSWFFHLTPLQHLPPTVFPCLWQSDHMLMATAYVPN